MLPRLEDSDRLFINKFVYHFESIGRGDVVVFKLPRVLDGRVDYIKRLVGLPGETIRIYHGDVFVKSAGSEAKLSYLGHVLTENRNGLVVVSRVTKATGTAEREAALEMIKERKGGRRVTMGGDKGYDVQEFVADVRDLGVTPHVAQNNRNRRSAVDERTTRHAGYEISQRKRKRVEEVFGWLKTIGLMRQTRHRGRERVSWMFTFAAAVYNLVRIRNLTAEAA